MTVNRHTLIVTVAMVIVLGALGITFYYKGNTEALKSALQTAHWVYAPFAVLAGLLVYPVKALRWRVILGAGQNVRYRTLFSSVMIGFMANCIVSRLGEIIRAWVASLKGEIRTSTALASIALERIFDMFIVVLFLLLALQWMPSSSAGSGDPDLMQRLAGAKVGLAAMIAVGIAFLVLLRLYPAWMTAQFVRLARVLPQRFQARTEAFLQTFLSGLDTLRDWRQVAVIVILSVIHWGLQVVFFLLAGYCFPDMGMSVPVALLIFAVVAFGVAGLPLPGYIGIYQIAVLGAGAIVGMHGPQQQAAWLNYAWLSWVLNIPFVILAGFIVLWWEGLTLGQIRKQGSQT